MNQTCMKKGLHNMKETMRCKGCGAVLQDLNQDHVGFTPDLTNTYCQACYKLMHYGEVTTHFHPEDLPSLPSGSLIFMVSNVLHIDLLFSYPVYRYQSDATFVYIINQIDLLPRSTNLNLLLDKITMKAKKEHIPYHDIILMSSKNPHDIDLMKNYIQHHPTEHVYLLGVQNSGKTTLFKAITQDQNALAFKKAGLTQDVLSKTYGKHKIYDMPGLYQKGYLHQFLSYESYKRLIPDHEMKPKIYQMKPFQAVMLEGLVALTVLKAMDIVFYGSDQTHIHKTNKERIQALLEDREHQFKVYGSSYEKKTFKIPEGKYQITCADMGFFHVSGPAHIELTYVKDMHISLSEALFQ